MNGVTETICDVLERNAIERPGHIAYTLLADGEREAGSYTFDDLLIRVRRTASWLWNAKLAGKTGLVLLSDALQFVEGFLGCLAAGVIAVPATLPKANGTVRGLTEIAKSAGVAFVITSRSENAALIALLQETLRATRWLYLEDAIAGSQRPPGPRPGDTAMLQFTSGSTSDPKGVVITHANLMHNEAAISEAMAITQESLFVGWLPLFHDMGLIGNLLQPLYRAIRCVLMPPMAFLQQPIRWLRAIERYRATTSGAPNFAYDLCVTRTTPEQRAALDLSSWRVAFNGSEPVRLGTIERFATAFRCAGFRREAFFPCYGMAEATLMVSGRSAGGGRALIGFPQSADVAGTAGPGTAAGVVSCGRPVRGTHVVVVEPNEWTAVPEGEVGEIWVTGQSVSAGYYGTQERSREVFEARLRDTGEGPFLRTGDLGFVRDGELFITGRLKDVLIVRGRNHYPQDIEDTAARSNRFLVRGGAAAVMCGIADGSELTIVHELTREGWRRADPDSIAADVREAVASEHGLSVRTVLLIKPGTLPRTTSGKVRRQLCRQMAQEGSFVALEAARVGREGLR